MTDHVYLFFIFHWYRRPFCGQNSDLRSIHMLQQNLFKTSVVGPRLGNNLELRGFGRAASV